MAERKQISRYKENGKGGYDEINPLVKDKRYTLVNNGIKFTGIYDSENDGVVTFKDKSGETHQIPLSDLGNVAGGIYDIYDYDESVDKDNDGWWDNDGNKGYNMVTIADNERIKRETNGTYNGEPIRVAEDGTIIPNSQSTQHVNTQHRATKANVNPDAMPQKPSQSKVVSSTPVVSEPQQQSQKPQGQTLTSSYVPTSQANVAKSNVAETKPATAQQTTQQPYFPWEANNVAQFNPVQTQPVQSANAATPSPQTTQPTTTNGTTGTPELPQAKVAEQASSAAITKPVQKAVQGAVTTPQLTAPTQPNITPNVATPNVDANQAYTVTEDDLANDASGTPGTTTTTETTPTTTTAPVVAPTPTVATPSGVPTIRDTQGNLKNFDSYQQEVQEYIRHNTMDAPQPTQVNTTRTVNYEDILRDYMTKSQEDTEADKKKARQRAILAGVTDGINALASLWGTTIGAKATAPTDPKLTLSAANQARYDKIRAEQEQQRKDYLNLRLQLAKAEETANTNKLNEAYRRDRLNETAYNNSVRAAQQAKNALIKSYNDERNAEIKKIVEDNKMSHNQKMEALRKYGIDQAAINKLLPSTTSREIVNPVTGNKETVTSTTTRGGNGSGRSRGNTPPSRSNNNTPPSRR